MFPKLYTKFFTVNNIKKYDITDSDTIFSIFEDQNYLLCNTQKFTEAVIDVTPELNKIRNILTKIFKDIKRPIEIDTLISIIEKKLSDRKIRFMYIRDDSPVYIISASFNINTDFIILLYTNKIFSIFKNKDNYKNFINDAINLLGHELIHRIQQIKTKQEKIKSQQLGRTNNEKRIYYSNKNEIMSYAWQIINEFRMHGKQDRDIGIILQANSDYKLKFSLILNEYHKLFSIKDNVLKLLYKYMYSYLQK